MAMVGDHNTPPHDSSRPDAVESHHPCIVHGVMRPWLFHLAWIGRRLHPCYSHRLIRLVLKKKISIELVGSSDLTRLFLNSVCASAMWIKDLSVARHPAWRSAGKVVRLRCHEIIPDQHRHRDWPKGTLHASYAHVAHMETERF